MLSQGQPEGNICNWKGHPPDNGTNVLAMRAVFSCTDGILTKLNFVRFAQELGQIRLHYLPPTLQDVRINFYPLTGTLNTRALPRELRHVSVRADQLHGRIELRTLPNKLEHGDFAVNRFQGPITLTALPPSLRELSILMNAIRQHSVCYGALPKNLEQIRLDKKVGIPRAVDSNYALQRPGKFFKHR